MSDGVLEEKQGPPPTLQTLPGEIRNLIYDMLFDSFEICIRAWTNASTRPVPLRVVLSDSQDMSFDRHAAQKLASTCHMLRKETITYLWSNKVVNIGGNMGGIDHIDKKYLFLMSSLNIRVPLLHESCRSIDISMWPKNGQDVISGFVQEQGQGKYPSLRHLICVVDENCPVCLKSTVGKITRPSMTCAEFLRQTPWNDILKIRGFQSFSLRVFQDTWKSHWTILRPKVEQVIQHTITQNAQDHDSPGDSIIVPAGLFDYVLKLPCQSNCRELKLDTNDESMVV
ncbi:hypothetical protein NA57DRAFT_56246 [Rhizodiscina lignyota]|uniref:Uncharacterized protein n=1 Tax=Rhizodiscina lignyota TaxID=1504668 RepID=A0A9P4MAB0_9PEZI|nr:hypothetical protein NA57DRAFT_56246 [Rhizodiscina lignyota]